MKKEQKLQNLVEVLIKKTLNEEYTPKPGSYTLNLTVESDGSVVIKGSNLQSHLILANVIGIPMSQIKKYGEYFGQNMTDFLFFTKNKKELFK